MSLYRASKEYKVPWSTLKVNVDRVKEERNQGITQIKMLKEGQDRASKDNTSDNEENDHIGEDHDQSQDKQPRSTASTESDQTTDNAKNSSKSEFKSPLPKNMSRTMTQCCNWHLIC
ncbi:unnamed protein product [Parnassius apollo]|uniref:(apollo) hypothetical protein n=1 Tax=Parnassius apollo TaxID=110799 RepID=A0A8S3WZV6_PARAO|nr:unnamed protein product [Parnassius apollo]